jgi:hypothetical protein
MTLAGRSASTGARGGTVDAGTAAGDASRNAADAGNAGTASSAPTNSDGGKGIAPGPDAGDANVAGRVPELTHAFDPITVGAGEEQNGLCQSWTVGNDQPVYVNTVVASNDGAFHHSNWIWIDDGMFTGPDGTWPCVDRGFDQILAGAAGGVFFAQSTQARRDVQQFPVGAAFQMPAHARIVGDVHLLNPGQVAITTQLRFDVYTLPEADVRVPLQPMAFTNTALDIVAGGETRARMQCATPQPDFDIYYILPHFHLLGLNMAIDVAGGALDATTIYRSAGNFGDAWGQTFDPPIAIRGAEALGITCDYQNPRTSAVQYGEGDQEMCVTLIYSSGAKAGGIALSNLSVSDEGGVHRTDALCVSVGTP